MSRYRHASLLQRLPRSHPLDAWMRPGHRIRVLTDGHEAWTVLLRDLAAARRNIAIELYMLADDAIGRAFVEALEAARARGVAVRLMVDGIGTARTGRQLVDRLAQAGVETHVFGPIRMSVPWRRWMQRNHRKVFVIDAAVAHVTGMNVTSQYFASHPEAPTWADAGVRVEGPLVADLVAELNRNWRARQGVRARLVPPPQPPVPAPVPYAHAQAAVAFNRGRIRQAQATRRYLQAVRAAQTSILLAQSYFLPEPVLERSLARAARSGVRVAVLIPSVSASDVLAVSLASVHAIGRLIAAGVEVYVSEKRMVHAKFGVIDDRWWTVGSANLDPMSHHRNLEANVVGVGEVQARELTRFFQALRAESTPLTREVWLQRPVWQKLLGWLASRFSWLF